ncbi:MAG TPA: tRNA (N6-isopentenyl adenosine(37)-C2)-methylthiotransferase MiaB [Firmicutes bacterium]|nr:tRNA (N6-isopentenyl adenosine(37)-C2)-methylthiotransferase MiaB [Candidatus Fermentithermobacillaceae bacterium]
MGRYYVETHGCQMNERDSETIAALLEQMGYVASGDPRNADLLVINTCAVREAAERKAWARLRELASVKKRNRDALVVLAGCVAEIPQTLDRARELRNLVDILVGPAEISKLPELIREAEERRELCYALSGPRRGKVPFGPPPEGMPRKLIPGVSAYVTIMYGCDNFCTYCVVPFVRGPQLSRKPEDIIDEVRKLAGAGYKEVFLLGQNVNAYGLDLGGEYRFHHLLRDLNQIKGLVRIRYATSHPRDFSEEMVDVIASLDKVCEHFHLPVQSGSDRILKAMNRGYTREQYIRLVDYIKGKIPGASVTTDIIVGFPGETEEDFKDTLSLVEHCRFDGAFTFIFSPRRGSAAARMPDQIPYREKQRRLELLVDVTKRITLERNEQLLGSVVEVLIEGPDERTPGAMRGRTRTNKIVIATDGGRVGDLVLVKVEEAGTWYLKGSSVRSEGDLRG